MGDLDRIISTLRGLSSKIACISDLVDAVLACNCNFALTELSPPIAAPTGTDAQVLLNPTTGELWYWNGSIWVLGNGIDSVLALNQVLTASRRIDLDAYFLQIGIGAGSLAIDPGGIISAGDLYINGNETVFVVDDFNKFVYALAAGNTVKFGINTTVPTVALDVVGAGKFTGDVTVPDEAYNATTWDGSLEVPTKNAIRDEMENHTHVMTDVTDLPVLAYGTFDPELASQSNVTAVAEMQDFFYTRIGNIVHISGSFEAISTTIGTAQVTIQLPIPSTFVSNYDLSGVITSNLSGESETNSGMVYHSVGDNKTLIEWQPKGDNVDTVWRLEATYIIL